MFGAKFNSSEVLKLLKVVSILGFTICHSHRPRSHEQDLHLLVFCYMEQIYTHK